VRVAGLFAGIGGFELGLSTAGHRTDLLCDILPTAQEVLRARFPEADLFSDVVALKALSREIEIVTAGFPCQDLSQAGRTAGLAGHRSGLIGEVFRLLEGRKRSRRPVPLVIVENVPFMLQLGGGGAMRAIVDEFQRLQYLWAYRVVDSFGFGLPQRRERVYLVAASRESGIDPASIILADDAPIERPKTAFGSLAHGFYWTEGIRGLGWAVNAVPTLKNGSTIGIASPPAVLLPGGMIVKPGLRTAEKLQGFEPGWTEPAEKVGKKSLRWALVGNAVSVPVPKWVGGRIANPGDYDLSRDRPFPEAGKAPRAARFDGARRYAVEISADPLGLPAPHLDDLMGSDFELLSEKATAGFLSRTQRAKLKFPPGFIDAVAAHLERMRSGGYQLPLQMRAA
jgi:DNA (cytosine-5)-methyltransferase 1